MVTLGSFCLRFSALEELDRGAVTERLARAYRVIDVFLAVRFGIESFEFQ